MGVSTGQLDAAQMVAAMPLALTMGMNGSPSVPTSTALVLSRNGNAITLSRELFEQGIRNLNDFKMAIFHNRDRVFKIGVVHECSMHNLMLRYWLAAGGIDPDRDVTLVTLPPQEMAERLRQGQIDGFCVGEPWSSKVVADGTGFVIATDLEIWAGNPEKVLGVTEEWQRRNPNTMLALIKALLEACEYCDEPRHRSEMVNILHNYLDLPVQYILPSLVGPYQRGTHDPGVSMPRFHQFHVDNANCPGRVEGLWILTQLARWNISPFPKNWVEILDRVRRVDLFLEASQQLGHLGVEPDRSSFYLFDGIVFDPDRPMEYLERQSICRSFPTQEINLDLETVAHR
jgi:nitrate/nitrite transport system ATP-binding protein